MNVLHVTISGELRLLIASKVILKHDDKKLKKLKNLKPYEEK